MDREAACIPAPTHRCWPGGSPAPACAVLQPVQAQRDVPGAAHPGSAVLGLAWQQDVGWCRMVIRRFRLSRVSACPDLGRSVNEGVFLGLEGQHGSPQPGVHLVRCYVQELPALG